MAWALMILVIVALGLLAGGLNRRTVARYVEDGTMPRSKRLQQQVIAASAKAGKVPSWADGPAHLRAEPPKDAPRAEPGDEAGGEPGDA
jgi:hypothetical protein